MALGMCTPNPGSHKLVAPFISLVGGNGKLGKTLTSAFNLLNQLKANSTRLSPRPDSISLAAGPFLRIRGNHATI